MGTVGSRMGPHTAAHGPYGINLSNVGWWDVILRLSEERQRRLRPRIGAAPLVRRRARGAPEHAATATARDTPGW